MSKKAVYGLMLTLLLTGILVLDNVEASRPSVRAPDVYAREFVDPDDPSVRANNDETSADSTPPLYQNVGPSNGTSVPEGGTMELYAQGKDAALASAWLETNETGSWKNYTEIWGTSWTEEASNPIFEKDNVTWTTSSVGNPAILRSPINGTPIQYDGCYWMAYSTDSRDGGDEAIGLANSTDLIVWNDFDSNPILNEDDADAEIWETGYQGANDYSSLAPNDFLYMADDSGVTYDFWLFYTGVNGNQEKKRAIGIAKSNNMTTWVRDLASNPIATWIPDWVDGAEGIEDWRLQKMSNGSWVAVYEADGAADWGGTKATVGIAKTDNSLPNSGWTDEGQVFSSAEGSTSFNANPTIIRYDKAGTTHYEMLYEWSDADTEADAYGANVTEGSDMWTIDGWTKTTSYNPIIAGIPATWEDDSVIPNALIHYENQIMGFYVGGTASNKKIGSSTGPHLVDFGTTKHYDSPMDMSWLSPIYWGWSNFTWCNSSLSAGTVVAWRIYYNDTSGNVNGTVGANTHCFTVRARSPYDIAIMGVTVPKTVVGQGYSMNITVSVGNQGDFTESFNVSVFYDDTAIILPDGKNHTTTTLPSGSSTALTIPWNTTDTSKGNYIIKAHITPLPGETDTTDNTLTDGIITVSIPGDVDGDRDVDLYDVVKICTVYGSRSPYRPYKPNCDINCDGIINLYDVVIACIHYGQKEP